MSDHTMAATILETVLKTCGTCIWLDSNSDCELTTHAVTEDTVCDCPPEFGHYERRTCGNCNLSDHEELLCGLEYEDGSHDNITLDAIACIDWCKRYVSDEERIELLEQRCQQLEQVARDLYNSAWCAWFLKINAEMPELDKGLKEKTADSYLQNEREQLESLGVSLDD